mmetsp:Transcript_28713/g.83233  ORF Transcript_28713/g.83233 Transcript_28713/m.83233 type:complete len:327 (+) Transcript_28713:85-1065(+)
MLRELEEALRYEAASDKRRQIVEDVAALADGQKAGQLPDLEALPITYESDGMLKMLGGPCLLSYGRASPFGVREIHPDPSLALKYALMSRDEENIGLARRWTGRHPAIRLDFDVIRESTRPDMTIFMGECWLRNTDLWNFAGKFRAGCSPYAWPDCFAVLQCPFCCRMSTPCHPQSGVAESRPERKIMIMTNVSQFSVADGRMHMPHRALPRLCCVECFVSNLKSSGGDERAKEGGEDWTSYPNILERGVAFTAARDLLENASKGKTEIERSCFLPDAYTLYSLYDTCGMCPAITACIQDAQSDLISTVSKSVGNINLNYKPQSGK